MRKFFGLIVFIIIYLTTIAQAGIVEPVYKQFKNPNLDGEADEPSTTNIQITPDGKKMFLMDHLNSGTSRNIFIYNLTTPFDISTLDVDNRTLVSTDGLGQDFLGDGNQNMTLEFNNDGSQAFILSAMGPMQIHNLETPYDVASISTSTIAPDNGINFDFDTSHAIFGLDKRANNNTDFHQPFDLDFNNDGTKMYITDMGKPNKNTQGIMEYTLSTPYVPSSVTSSFDFDLSSFINLQATEMAFDDDGTRLYVSDSGSNPRRENNNHSTTHIFVWKLSVPYSLASATYIDKFPLLPAGVMIGSYSFEFGNNGMKLYVATEDETSDASVPDDAIFEYDLTCPYGVVICETDAITAIGAQVEIAKNVIYQNSSTIFKRFEWLRRNDERAYLANHDIKLNFHNPILAALKTNFENSLNNIQFTPASSKKEKPSKNKKKWSHWSHVDISFGRVGDTATSKPKEVKTKGFMYGLDKLVDNKIFGYAFRYGKDDVDLEDGSSNELDAHTLSLNMYSSFPVKSQSNLNLLLGVSYLKIDQLAKNRESGGRNGKQIYTSISYENENAYTKYALVPFGKFEMGITQFSDYTDFGVVSKNVETHERLTFRTGNASAGLKFDSILYLKDKTLSRNGFIEYIYDLTPDIDHYVRSHLDNVTLKKTIKTHSLHNVKGNIGFEYMNSKGSTIAINYERFQSLDESGHKDSLLIKLGTAKKQNANFDVIYDPTNNNKTEISYLKNFGNFKLKLKSNYNLFSKIPDYGANIEFSGTF